MAANLDERTEPATPRRKQEARDKGQVARSQDLTAAVLLLAAFVALRFVGPWLWEGLIGMTAAALHYEAPLGVDALMPFAIQLVVETGKRVAPILLIAFISIIVILYVQVGNLFTAHPLIPNLTKINPISGVKRLFSMRSVMQAVINMMKLALVAALAYLTLYGSAEAIIHAFIFGLHDAFSLGSSLIFQMGLRLSIAMVILALLDFAWQRYRHERELRMTKEEVKDELRNMEGNPQIKRHRRQMQLQMAMHRLKKDVPTADVVVTNPTHIAIAIRYDAESMPAPRIVAKGADYAALRIRQIARDHGIPIVERKPLARALYDAVDVGQYIPERFYRAIAEILAYIYELTGKSPGQGRDALALN
jgi:flagellar biosynthesis protein FlhB